MDLIQQISAWVDEVIADRPDLFVVHLDKKGAGSAQKIMIHLDGDQGVKIEDCVKVSRFLERNLEEQEIINSAYTIEVSSAGLDHPLATARQYVKNIGRSLKVSMQEGKEEKGKLLAANDSGIILAVERKEKGKKKVNIEEVSIAYSDIVKAFVQVSFN
jgi:ribosome maturation factor RimP